MDKKTGIGFEALFSSASMGIIIVDQQGIIALVNPFLLQQFGYTADEIIGQRIEKLIPMRFHARHAHHVSNYNEHPKSRPMGLGMDLFAARKDGSEFPVEVSLGNYQTPQGNFTIAFLSDISKRKEAQQALMQLNAELEQKVAERTQSLTSTVKQLAQQMMETEAKDAELRLALEKEKELSELKSRFVSMASHEFRTPLSTVLSSAYLISKYTSEEDHSKREKHVQRIVSSVNMLTDILNDFLSVGKIEEGKIQVRYACFNVKQHVEHTISELGGLLRNGQHISFSYEGDEQVELDPSLLKHIVINLLSNAIKFSPEHTEIEVRGKTAANSLELHFTDKGMGISEEDQQHLFERFFRGTNVTNIQGTGLGLHIVSKYAELMNGAVACRSKLGEGTTFIVRFHFQQQD